jgi:hypothetical protein
VTDRRDELPPWRWRNIKRNRELMIAWVHRKLDELDEPGWQELNRPKMSEQQYREVFEWRDNLGQEIALADGGNVGPLRDKMIARANLPPEVAALVAKFFCSPKPGKRRHVKFKNWAIVDAAARDVDRITAIWHEYYPDDYPANGHRLKEHGPSAFEIATLQWWPWDDDGSLEDAVRRRWRELHKHSSP